MKRNISVTLFALFCVSCALPHKALALPSYARQTGLPCSGCHYTPPELNPAGRLFKLLGYTDKTKNSTVPAQEPDKRRAPLEMLQTLPLGAWFETSFTSIKKGQPATQNGSFEFPQDISLFLAGAWSEHIGSFLQVTYDAQANSFSMDNTDIRFAKKAQAAGKDLVYGITLNNNPSVEDVWMGTPAWGFPFISNDYAPIPAASAIIQGPLAQDVAGLGAYSIWDNHFYVASSIYRSDHIGNSQPNNGQGKPYNIRGVAPYWRVAYQNSGRKNVFEVGGYGIYMASTPNAVIGKEDSYNDVGPDVEYDRTIGRDVLSFRGTYLHETSSLDATFAQGGASLVNHHLDTGNANAEYHFGNRLSTAFGWFATGGTVDTALYAPGAITGSANGNPKSAGYIANLSVFPWQNLDLAFQYTGYTSFNGGSTNYDGSGRDASANNSVYLLARFMF